MADPSVARTPGRFQPVAARAARLVLRLAFQFAAHLGFAQAAGQEPGLGLQ